MSDGNAIEDLLTTLLDESNDLYLTFVDLLFGGGSLLNPEKSIFSEISLWYNLGILFFVTGVVGYKVIMFGAHTALSGVYGDQKISAFWGTLTISLALMASVPMPGSGYSPAQYILKDLHVYGVELANDISMVGAKYLQESGSLNPPDIRNTDPIVFAVLANEMCKAIANRDIFADRKNGYVAKQMYCQDFDGKVSTVSAGECNGLNFIISWDHVSFDQKLSANTYNGHCGSINIANENKEGNSQEIDYSAPEDSGDRSFFGRVSDRVNEFIGDSFSTEKSETYRTIHDRKFRTEIDGLLGLVGRISNLDFYKEMPNPYSPAAAKAKMDVVDNKLSLLSTYRGISGLKNKELLETREKLRSESDYHYKQYILRSDELRDKIQNTGVAINRSAGDIRQAQGKFENTISSTAARSVAEFQSARSGDSENLDWIDELDKRGFATLGFFHWTIINVNNRVRDLSKISMTVEEQTYRTQTYNYKYLYEKTVLPDMLDAISRIPSGQKNGYGNLKTARESTIARSTDGSETADNQRDLTSSNMLSMFNGVSERILDYVRKIFHSDQDLILVIHELGEILIGASLGILSLTYFGGAAATTVAVASKGAAVAFGGIPGVLLAALASTLGDIAGLLLIACIPALILGIVMMFYIPLMGAILWSMSLLGLVINWLTALFVIPLWIGTLAFASTTDAWESQHYRQGFVMIVGLIMRPPLMAIAFYVSYVLIQIAGILVQLILDVAVGMMGNNPIIGLVGFLPVTGIVVMVAWRFIARIFSLASDLPDNIMKGLNAGYDTFSTQGDEEGIRATVFAGTKGGAAMLVGSKS
jgi:conjugal transfer/type IV secretion protein DotA/TraY